MGSLAGSMALHIVLMNLVAPMLAFASLAALRSWRRHAPSLLTAATILQLLFLWAWHAPPAMEATARFHLLHLAMQASLLATAFLFWSAILAHHGEGRWKPVVALLVTSKLFCLLAVLMVFSPRMLYAPVAAAAYHHGSLAASGSLDDQQLAGLIMLVACPVTFVLAGIVLAGRWILEIDRETETPQSPSLGARA
jgi:putative membrane protein